MRNPFRDAAQRLDTVQAAAPDDEKVCRMGCGHQRLDGPRVDLLRQRPAPTNLLEIDRLTFHSRDHPQRDPKARRKLLGSIECILGRG